MGSMAVIWSGLAYHQQDCCVWLHFQLGNCPIWCALGFNPRLNLINLYIKDLLHNLCSSVIMFANDIPLYKSYVVYGKNMTVFVSRVIFSLIIASWCKTWQMMTLNLFKCEALCISSKRSSPSFQYYVLSMVMWSSKLILYIIWELPLALI